MYIKNIFLVIFLGCMLSNCEMIVKVPIPETPTKLVVTSFIAPQDTLLEVVVSESTPLYKPNTNTSKEVLNATVQLSDGANTIILPHKEKGRYQVKASLFAISQGKTYELRVTHPDGRKVNAKCTIPLTQNPELKAVFTKNIEPNQYEAKISWIDDPQANHYYRFLMYQKYPYNMDNDSTWIEQGDAWADDKNRQGAIFAQTRNVYKSSANKPIPLLFLLLSTDEAYQRYHFTIEASQNNDGNPFAEPLPVYTNIEGGLGVFAGYQRYELRVNFKE